MKKGSKGLLPGLVTQVILLFAIWVGFTQLTTAGESDSFEIGVPETQRAFLKKFVGSWEFSAKGYSETGELLKEIPGGYGYSHYSWVLAGNFLEERVVAQTGFGPYLGIGLYGYDSLQKKVFWSWYSNGDTGIFTNEGDVNAAGDTLVLNGRWPDVVSGKVIHTRSTTTFIDDNHFVYKSYVQKEKGGEYLFSTFEYKRL